MHYSIADVDLPAPVPPLEKYCNVLHKPQSQGVSIILRVSGFTQSANDFTYLKIAAMYTYRMHTLRSKCLAAQPNCHNMNSLWTEQSCNMCDAACGRCAYLTGGAFITQCPCRCGWEGVNMAKRLEWRSQRLPWMRGGRCLDFQVAMICRQGAPGSCCRMARRLAC